MSNLDYPRTATISTGFTGIQANVTIPMSWTTPNPDEWIAFYLGLDDSIEGGISYKNDFGQWHYFLNPSGTSLPIVPQPNPGSGVGIKLVNTGGGNASLYINGIFVKSTSLNLGATTAVKMVCSYHEPKGANEVSHSTATFSNVQTQAKIGGPWSPFPTDMTLLSTTQTTYTHRYTVTQWSPLVASLAT